MHRFFVTGIAITVAGSAWAADSAPKMPVKAESPTAPAAFTWTGCYLGAHVGGAWGRRDFSDPAGFDLADGTPLFGVDSLSQSLPASGLLAGIQAGCKYQFAKNWIVGVEGEFSGARLTGDRQMLLAPFPAEPAFTVPANLHVQTDWIASATGSLGYSFNGLLVYAKGGAAWARNKYDLAVPVPDFLAIAPADFRAQETRTGWTAGAGVEYPLGNQFSAKLEYDYYDFGIKAVQFTDQLSSPSSLGAVDIKQHVHAVKLGFNYYFWNIPPGASLANSASAPGMTWNETFSAEARYFSWRGTRGTPTNAIALGPVSKPLGTPGSGAEFYMPYSAQLVGQGDDLKIEMIMRGGWVWARQSTAGLTGTVQTATDTVASATVTYLGFKGVQPFVSLDVNLPTGLAALTPAQANARMDPDLVDISTFGEGLNVGPTLGVNVPLNDAWLATVSAGYTHRGRYVMEGPLTPPGHDNPSLPTNVTPGDAFTVTGVLGYQAGPLSAKVTGTVTQNGTTKQDGLDFVRSGRRYLIAATGSYTWPDDHTGTTTVNASVAHSNFNEVLFQCLTGCPTTLVTEPFNTNSNLYQIGVEHLFAFNQFAVGPTGSFLFRDNNGYEPTTLQFVPEKERWSAGLLARYAPNNSLSFNAKVEHIWTHENDAPGLPNSQLFSVLAGSTVAGFTVPVISSSGWQFAVGTTATF